MTNRHGIPVLPAATGNRKPRQAQPAKKAKKVTARLPTKHEILFTSFDGKCHYCGAVLLKWHEARRAKRDNLDVPPSQMPTIDHKIPRIKGGTSALENLVLACAACNCLKSREDYEVFVAAMAALEGEP